MIEGYWDFQLPYLLKYGFPLDFPRDKEHLLNCRESCHSSATEYSKDIEHYLNTEIGHKVIHGPFKRPPLEQKLIFHPS